MKKFFISILLIGAAFALIIAPGSQAYAENAAISSSSSKFVVCSNQTYALCAVASCFVMDGLAYCACDVESGDSISLADSFGDGQNVCTVNAEGVDNGYMVSTY